MKYYKHLSWFFVKGKKKTPKKYPQSGFWISFCLCQALGAAWASVRLPINNFYSALKLLFSCWRPQVGDKCLQQTLKQWHVQTQILEDFPPSVHANTYRKSTYICTWSPSDYARTHAFHSVCWQIEIRPSLHTYIVAITELDRFQALLQQCAILCSAPPYGGGRAHEDQRNIKKHKWDQSLWTTYTQSLWSARITAEALFPCHAVLRLKSWRQWAVSPDEASSPQTPPSLASRQHTTSNGHHRDERIFCLVWPQCGLLWLLVSPAEWMFHRRPRGELTQDDTGLTRKYKQFCSGGANQRWSASRKKKKKRVKSGDKSNNSQCKQQRRLAGSLHAKIGLLVLTRTIHTPERNTGDMRAMLRPGVIEHLHTLYSHLSIHAKPPAEDAGTGYLLSFVRVFHLMVSGKLSAVTQIDGNLLLTSADTDRTMQIE